MLKPRLADLNRRTMQRLPALAGLALIVLALACGLAWRAHRADLEARLLATPPDQLDGHADLVAFADRVAKPLYAKECASCHGADMKGNAGLGAPNLTDRHWLYRDDVFHTERIILYGVRSGDPRAKNIAEMPAFGLKGQLDATEVSHVVQYVLAMSGQPHSADAAELGRQIYAGPEGACFDCHAHAGTGNPDYGATDLTANTWAYGGSQQALYDSIYAGRHGIMPAWHGKLSLAQIRALSVYVHSASHN